MSAPAFDKHHGAKGATPARPRGGKESAPDLYVTLGKLLASVDGLRDGMKELREDMKEVKEESKALRKEMSGRIDEAQEETKALRKEMNDRFNKMQEEIVSVKLNGERLNGKMDTLHAEMRMLKWFVGVMTTIMVAVLVKVW